MDDEANEPSSPEPKRGKPEPEAAMEQTETRTTESQDTDIDDLDTGIAGVGTALNSNINVFQSTYVTEHMRASTALSAGKVSNAIIDQATRAFAPPTGFDEALAALRTERIVILRGARGSGREAAALNLLRAIRTDDVTAFSPHETWARLTGRPFTNNTGYVISDQVQEERGAVAQFNFDQVSSALHKAGATCRLLVTTTPGAHLPENAVVIDLTAPQAHEVIDAELAARTREVTTEELDHLYSVAAMNPTPRAVSKLVDQAFADPRGLSAHLRDAQEATTAVRDHIEAAATSPEKLAMIVTLAFFPGSTRSDFGRLQSRLLDRLTPRPPDAPSTTTLAPSLIDLRAFSLVEEQTTAIDEFGTHDVVVVPRHETYQRHCLRDLFHLYGAELWGPIREWIDDVVSTLPHTATHAARRQMESIAIALLRLSEITPGEVLHHYVEPWLASTEEPMNEYRFAIATMTLSGLDRPAGSGVRRAVAWCKGKESLKVSAASFALSGPLGLQAPFDTLNALWTLAPRRRAALIANLFHTAVVIEGDADAVLRFIDRRHVQAASRGAAFSEPAMDLLRVMLRRDRKSDDAMPMAQYLASRPDAARSLIRALLPALNTTRYQDYLIVDLFTVLDNAARHFPEAGIASRTGAALEELMASPASPLTSHEAQDLVRHMVDLLVQNPHWSHLFEHRDALFPGPPSTAGAHA